jgi:hypothetical protein
MLMRFGTKPVRFRGNVQGCASHKGYVRIGGFRTQS